jgi:restriction system protein
MIPDFQSIMLPLMSLAGDGLEHTSRETVKKLAAQFKLSDLDRQELLPSGTQAIFDNRVGWAKTHLKKAGLLESPKRSVFRITDRGKAVLIQKPASINMPFLRQYPEYVEFTRATSNNGSSPLENNVSDEILKNTPEETLEYAYQKIRQTLAQDILTKVKTVSPAFFEKLVVELLVKMGYGGSIKDAGKAIGKSGDEGIDGIIKEDKLGLDVIYIQAKRWEGGVGRPELHKFVGALAGQGAKKGIFISTSYFTKDAKEYTPKNETKIVLIDGEQLAQFMIDYNLGVSRQNFYEIKKIDSDYFGDE